MGEDRAMEEFAENLWNNFLKEKAEKMMAQCMKGFRCVVTANPGGGVLTVQRPFDYDADGNPVSMTLKCAASLSSVTVGTQLLAVSLGSMSNAFILCKTDLSNL